MGGYARERTARRYAQSFDHYRHQESDLHLNAVRNFEPINLGEITLLGQEMRWSNLMLGTFAVHVRFHISITIIFNAIQYADAIRYAHEFSKYYPSMNAALRSSIQSNSDSPRCCDIAECVRGSNKHRGLSVAGVTTRPHPE
jgi:hypothetical protein